MKKPLTKTSLFHSEKLLFFSGFFLVPFSTLFIALSNNLITSNFTNYATKSTAYFLVWFLFTLFCFTKCLNHYLEYFKSPLNLQSFLFPVFVLLSAIFPYSNGLTLFGLLHVLFAYVAFFYLHLLLYFSFPLFLSSHPSLAKTSLILYSLILALSTLISIHFASINFLVEMIYISLSSILFTSVIFSLKKQ